MPATDYKRLARMYDLVVSYEDDIGFFVEEAKRTGGRSLELTAGTGRVSVPVAESGADLTCVDSSEEMLAELRRKAEEKKLSVGIVCQDITQLKLAGTYDLIFIPFNSFLEIAGKEDQTRTLAAVHAHLIPGGRFICTLHNPAVRLRSVGGRYASRKPLGPEGGGEMVVTLETELDEEKRVVSGSQTFEVLDKDGKCMEKLWLPLRFALLEEDEFRRMTAEQGFSVEALYGDYSRGRFDPRESPFMIWILRKS
jgi:SAM-dependent methyltransferase